VSAGISVRKLALADAQEYRSIRLAALQLAPEAFGSTYDVEAERPLSDFENRLQRAAMFAAYDGSDIVGMAGLVLETGPKDRHKGHLVGMFFLPQARGKGAGAALMSAVIAHAAECVEQLHLGVISDNDAAISLYRHFGFTAYGTEPRAIKNAAGVYSDEMLMVKFLTD
jgi:ribosomal protein S18 acetylase RimI-like enzyme